MSFICGFSGNNEDDLEDLCILPSTHQRKTTRGRPSFGVRSGKVSKNPYSDRGLDKFEALLADLDGKRQMIYTQKGSEDISFVRFTYSSSDNVKPIVVKVKDHRTRHKDHHDHKVHKNNQDTKTCVLSSPEHPVDVGDRSPCNSETTVVEQADPSVGCDKIVSFDQMRRNFGEWWRPWYSLPFFVILILGFLVFFGRSFAIFCTSVGWYMVPTVDRKSEIAKRPKNTGKKQYLRVMSEN